jgi:hypothetical protein
MVDTLVRVERDEIRAQWADLRLEAPGSTHHA